MNATPPDDAAIQRYSLIHPDEGYPFLCPDIEGKYLLYSDHLAQVKASEERAAALRSDLETVTAKMKWEFDMRLEEARARDALSDRLREAERSLSFIRGLNESACLAVGVEYAVHRDETVAVIAGKLIEALATSTTLAGLLKEIHAWLTAPKMETWPYHENGHFAEDKTKVIKRIDHALSASEGVGG